MITRRSLLSAAGTLVAAGKRKRRTTWPHMGWQQNLFPLVIVTAGPGFQGVFAYSPGPGPRNLVASITSHAGTDPFGNAYLAGITNYVQTTPTLFSAVQLLNGSVLFLTASSAGGPWNFTTVIGSGPNLLQYIFPLGSGTALVAPSGDTTGAADFSNINSLLASGTQVTLAPGTFYLNNQVTVPGTTLSGADMATVVRSPTTGAGYAGPLLAPGAKGVIRNLSVENSGSDAITVAGGVAEWWLTDLYFSGNAGWCINATITSPAHGRIRGIRGAGGSAANGGGINIDAGTGGAVTAEINIYDVDIQGVTATEIIRVQGVTDVLSNLTNGSVKAGVATNAISVLGACQTVHLLGVDVGGSSAGTAVCQVAAGTSVNSPTDIWISGKLQAGNRGLVVGDAVGRSRFEVDCTRNQLDGAQFTGTGQVNKLVFMGNLNNQSAGVAYDINVTSSAHLYIDAPQYGTPGGGAVTANLNVAIAGNHVSNQSPPAGSTAAGFAPAGW